MAKVVLKDVANCMKVTKLFCTDLILILQTKNLSYLSVLLDVANQQPCG